jgi:hypothetical protein
MASAACTALSEPLNAFGATTMFNATGRLR